MIKQLDLFAAFAAAEVQPVTVPAASPVKAEKKAPARVPAKISADMRRAFKEEMSEFGWGGRLYQICREQAKQELADIQAGRAFASPRYKKMLKSY